MCCGVISVFSGFSVDIKGNDVPALQIYDSAAGTYSNNIFQNAKEAVSVYSLATPVLDNNIIRNSTVGIELGWANSATYMPGVVTVSNNKLVNNTTHGIHLMGAAAGSLIQHNLIRGNNGTGIYIDSIQTPLVKLQNNLIVENGAGIHLVENAGLFTGANASLLGNTIANNTAIGVVIDHYTSSTVTNNIMAFNTPSNHSFNVPITLANSYNLSSDVSLAGVGDLYANPEFAQDWYLSDGSAGSGNTAVVSPALNASTGGDSALTVGYLTLNPYAQTALTDINQLDLGYHHDAPLAAASGISATAVQVISPGAGGSSRFTVTPLHLNPTSMPIGAGLQLSAIISTASAGGGEVVSSIVDMGDGSYEFTVWHGWNFAADSASVTVSYTGAGAGVSVVVTASWVGGGA